MKSYVLRAPVTPDNRERLKEYSDFESHLLFHRGITNMQEARDFLHPDYEKDLHDPFLMKDMRKAVERIMLAIEKGERIVVYGDYDCDGIPGAVILHDFFRKIDYHNADIYIPHRYKDGYGLNMEAIELFGTELAKVVITVDCGITDVSEVSRARELNIDVIITDHHLPAEDSKTGKQIIPSAYAVINNKQHDDPYPFKELCGAGTAFKLVRALLIFLRDKNENIKFNIPGEGWEKWLLDMAGLATIADMVPLVGENRVLAHFGLKVLRKSPRPGLQSLLRNARANQHTLSEDDVGFTIAPRVNAASRMGEPLNAFKMLSTSDIVEGNTLALGLHKLNDQRKGTVASMVKEAKHKLSLRIKEGSVKNILVLGSIVWMPGLLGLAANTLVEEYSQTVFLWGRQGSKNIKGSCRSNGLVNLVELMSMVRREVFIDFGGHKLSGGFSVSHEYIHELEEILNDAYTKLYGEENKKFSGELLNEQQIDAVLKIDDVNTDTYKQIECLGPFGIGNLKPTFLFKGIEVSGVSWFGRNKEHLRLSFLNKNNHTVQAIGFFYKSKSEVGALNIGKKISLVASFERSSFMGKTELRLRIIDIL